MYVIADIEWAEDWVYRKRLCFPTQIAAIRMDRQHNRLDEFSGFIKPDDRDFSDWSHIACTGGSFVDFFCADNAKDVLKRFLAWLDEDDIILWWHSNDESIYRQFVRKYCGIKAPQRSSNVYEAINRLSGIPLKQARGLYSLAGAAGVNIAERREHCAKDDAQVLYETLKALDFPPAPRRAQPPAVGNAAPLYPLTRREMNAAMIHKNRFSYVFSPDSGVFHRPDCSRALGARKLLGVYKYESAVGFGKRPCLCCAPSPDDVCGDENDPRREKLLRYARYDYSQKDIQRALRRQREAAAAREVLFGLTSDVPGRKADIMTLTDSFSAFFAGDRGGCFHTHRCVALRELRDICGFARFDDAKAAGYEPCPLCRPTRRYDLSVAVPTESRIRENEDISDIEPLCRMEFFGYHYEYQGESEFFCIETPAGKWKLDTCSSPVRLLHINIAISPNCAEYHVQPRVFLSFRDAFVYIKNHDKKLRRSSRQNIIYPSRGAEMTEAI